MLRPDRPTVLRAASRNVDVLRASRPSAARKPLRHRRGPSRGLSTSLATMIRVSASRGCRPVRSTRASRRQRAAAARKFFTGRRRAAAPQRLHIPAPPSVLALPPMPSTIVWHPWSSAALMTSPVPYELASNAASRSCGSSRQPDTSAISTTATPSRAANAVSTGSPVGPSARTGTRSNPAARAASSVPSPPSATGASTTSDSRGLGLDSCGDPRGHLSRGQRALELVGGRENMHAGALPGRFSRVGRWRLAPGRERRELLELDDVVQISAHGDVGDPLQDHLDDHRHAELRHQLLRFFERRQQLLGSLAPAAPCSPGPRRP